MTATADLTPRTAGLVGLIDRFFPGIWLAVYLLLPVSGWSTVMFDSWFDQVRDADALRSVLEEGRADAIADNVIGPAYIATAAAVHWVLGLGPEDALVFLNRASYALSVACGALLVRVLVRRLTSPPPVVSIAWQALFVGLMVAAGTWHWSDVPWSHFYAAFLAVAVYAVRFAPARASSAQFAGLGILVALLGLTRSFELVALALGFAAAWLVLAAVGVSAPRTGPARHLTAAAAGVAVTTVAVYLVTGKRDLFFLYSNHLDRQSGNVTGAEIAETPTFTFSFVPTKLVQLFVEPCHYAMCSVSDYAGGAVADSGPLADAAGNELLWRLPLSVQLPTLVLLPFCVLVVGGLVVWAARHRDRAESRARELRLLVETTVASSAIVLGYVSSTMTGSPHLRYGFARDFLLPALLTAVIASALAGAGAWLFLSSRLRGRRPSPESLCVVLAVVASFAAIGGAAYARAYGIPRIESRQLGPVEYTARCAGGSCDVSVAARTTAGRPLPLPERSTLTFGCGSDRARFTLYVERLSEPVRLTEPCADPRLVAAWPTVMGLPPGSYELGAVDVLNVP